MNNRLHLRPSDSNWLVFFLIDISFIFLIILLLQSYNQCYCGNYLGNTNVYQKKNEAECNRKCKGIRRKYVVDAGIVLFMNVSIFNSLKVNAPHVLFVRVLTDRQLIVRASNRD